MIYSVASCTLSYHIYLHCETDNLYSTFLVTAHNSLYVHFSLLFFASSYLLFFIASNYAGLHKKTYVLSPPPHLSSALVGTSMAASGFWTSPRSSRWIVSGLALVLHLWHLLSISLFSSNFKDTNYSRILAVNFHNVTQPVCVDLDGAFLSWFLLNFLCKDWVPKFLDQKQRVRIGHVISSLVGQQISLTSSNHNRTI